MIIYYNSNRKLVWYVSSLDPVALGSTNSRICADPKDQGGFWALQIWMKLETKVFSVPPALSEELIETVVQIYQKPSVPHTKCYKEPGKTQPRPNPQCNSKNLIAYRLTLAYEDIEELFTSLLFFPLYTALFSHYLGKAKAFNMHWQVWKDSSISKTCSSGMWVVFWEHLYFGLYIHYRMYHNLLKK